MREGLLTVSRTRATLWPKEGPPRRFSIEASELRAAAINVFVPPAHAAGDTAAAAVLLVVGAGPRPRAYDLSTGRKAWPRNNAHGTGMLIDTLSVHGDRLVCTGMLGVTVYEAATGEVAGCCTQGYPAELVAAELRGRYLYAVYRNRSGARRDSRTNMTQAVLLLVRVELLTQGATRPAHNALEPTTFRLKGAGTVRQAVWANQHLVLVAQDGLRAYTLP